MVQKWTMGLVASFVGLAAVDFSVPSYSGETAETEQRVIKILMKSHLTSDESVGVWVREHSYGPGWNAPTHFHNSDVFIYVVSGSFAVTTERDGRIVYTSGEAFLMESDRTMDAGNASQTVRLKIAVFQVGSVDQPFTVPVD